MIKSIKGAKGAKKFPCNWWPKVKALKRRKFQFKEGLNIIIGPNGSGKTTLTRTLAKAFYAEQGGRATFTQSAFMDMYDIGFGTDDRDNALVKSLEIEHDGGAVFYMNSGDTVGIDGSGIDWDFSHEGMDAVGNKGSAGQMTTHWFMRVCDFVKNYYMGEIEAIDDRLDGKCNDLYQNRIDDAKKFLKSNPKSRPTLILDEPESSVDLLQEIYLWKIIKDASEGMQVIVCTHSSFVLNMKDANFIEMEKGYKKKCLDSLTELKGD